MRFFRKARCGECGQDVYYAMKVGGTMLCQFCLESSAGILKGLAERHGTGTNFPGDETTGFQVTFDRRDPVRRA